LCAGAAALWLVVGSGGVPAGARSRGAPDRTASAKPPRPTGSVRRSLAGKTEVAPSPEATRALASLGSKLAARARSANGAAALEADLLARAKNEEPSALRVGLDKLLHDRPDLAPGAARAFTRLDDRERVFALSRSLAAYVAQPEVEATLEQAARSGPPAQREAALLALPEPRELALDAFASATAPATVRAAGAFVLAESYASLGPAAREAALTGAREIAGDAAKDGHLRAEALHLLARAACPGDAGLAARTLGETGSTAEVALAAAHLALAAGTAPGEVASALATRPERECAVAVTTLATLTPGRNP
jgi:hypothetical protein